MYGMKTRYVKRHVRAFWLFVAPCLLLFSTFFLIPLGLSVGFSFTNYDGWKVMNFIGLANYKELFADTKFYQSLGRTFTYTLFSLPFKVIIPLLIASRVTSKRVAIKGLARTWTYIPYLLSALVVGITINWMFSAEYGLVNFVIQSLGGTPLQWALNPKLATFVISFASNWASTGFYMVIFIGGLNNIPQEIYEAASIDGSTTRQTFLRITVPCSLPPPSWNPALNGNLLKCVRLGARYHPGGPGLNTTFIIQFIFDQRVQPDAVRLLLPPSPWLSLLFFAFIAYVAFKFSNGVSR
jgi:alpha-1,4-digalacturonate transport system permease protein